MTDHQTHVFVRWGCGTVILAGDDPVAMAHAASDLGYDVPDLDCLYHWAGEDEPVEGEKCHPWVLARPEDWFFYNFEAELAWLNPPEDDDPFYDLDHAYDGENL